MTAFDFTETAFARALPPAKKVARRLNRTLLRHGIKPEMRPYSTEIGKIVLVDTPRRSLRIDENGNINPAVSDRSFDLALEHRNHARIIGHVAWLRRLGDISRARDWIGYARDCRTSPFAEGRQA